MKEKADSKGPPRTGHLVSLNLNEWIKIVVIILSLASPSTSFLNPLKYLFGIETCSHPSVRDAKSAVQLLHKSLETDLFGQHLAQRTILAAINMHLDEPSPKKAMVLSLHGWAGSGKSFTTQLIMNALYEGGDASAYVKSFLATHHFPDPEKVKEYKETLKEEVIKTMRLCERSLFIFDEVDKLPAGLLDVLIPLIKPIGRLEEGLNVKKAIFLFLSNSGATKINEITLNAREAGKKRESLKLIDFEEYLSNEAFESRGGLYKSELIHKILVDWFVPFLPLEREHVKNCARRDAQNLAGNDKVGGFKSRSALSSRNIEEIADRMTYWPEDKKLFSVTGCKRVESLVKFQILTESDKNVQTEF